VVEPESDNRNRLQSKFKEAGWNVVTATTGNQALSASRAMLRIDAVLVSSRTKDMGHGDLISLLRGDYETAMTPIVVLSWPDDPIKASWLESSIAYLKAVEQTAEPEALVPEIDALKKKAGSMVLDADAARAYSLRAANILKDIAMTSRVFSAERARLALLDALTNRPDELVEAVAGALAQIPDAEITQSLAKVGTDSARSKPARVAALKALARAARTIGNKLNESQISALQAMAGTADDELRDAAGEALGGLNLDAAEGAKLILKHGDIEKPAAPAAVEVAVPPPPPPEAPGAPSTGAPAAAPADEGAAPVAPPVAAPKVTTPTTPKAPPVVHTPKAPEPKVVVPPPSLKKK
jgi:DNA-binding response OmpR family regulator